jgi:hypothetical protein
MHTTSSQRGADKLIGAKVRQAALWAGAGVVTKIVE